MGLGLTGCKKYTERKWKHEENGGKLDCNENETV